MKRVFAVTLTIAALVAITIGSAWAGTISSGLTGIAVSDSIVGAQHWYEFTLYNLSNQSNPSWDVLVGGLNVYGNGLPADPVEWLAPSGWEWTGGGWKNNLDQIFYNTQPGSPYITPPAIAPGGNLGGFVLKFDQSVGNPFLQKFSFESHVYAVEPIANPTNPQTYTPTNVTIPGTQVVNMGTWWDAPDTTDHNPPPWDHPVVPEASSVMLGMMGMIGPIGYALMKRRATR